MTITSFPDAVRKAYAAGQEDEALEPIVRVDAAGRPVGKIAAGDSVIFYDIRGEREVELTEALVDPAFSHFPARRLDLNFVTLIEYSRSLGVKVAFPPEEHLKNTLVEVLSLAGFRVIKVAESEKAIHVAYFFNGKSDTVFPREERVVVPSPQTGDYASVPAMSAAGVVDAVEKALAGNGSKLVIANLANVDVVGHIEDKKAVLEAIGTVDKALGRIVEAARREKAVLVVTADHGTVEEWLYPDGTVNTGHTKNPVPFILADLSGEPGAAARLRASGELADVAPTILALAGVAVPPEMTGRSLLEGPAPIGPRRKIMLLILDGWGRREDAVRQHDPGGGDAAFRRPLVGLPARRPRLVRRGRGHAGRNRRQFRGRASPSRRGPARPPRPGQDRQGRRGRDVLPERSVRLGDGARPGGRPGPSPHGHRLPLQLARHDPPSLRPPAHGPGRRA